MTVILRPVDFYSEFIQPEPQGEILLPKEKKKEKSTCISCLFHLYNEPPNKSQPKRKYFIFFPQCNAAHRWRKSRVALLVRMSKQRVSQRSFNFFPPLHSLLEQAFNYSLVFYPLLNQLDRCSMTYLKLCQSL